MANYFGLNTAASAPRMGAPGMIASTAGRAAGAAGGGAMSGLMGALTGSSPWGMAAGVGVNLLGNIFKGIAGENKIAKRQRKETANLTGEQVRMANLERALMGEQGQRQRSVDPLARQSLDFLMQRLQGRGGTAGALQQMRQQRPSTLPPGYEALAGR